MKTIGIIAEYNPFHNGHEWQIREVRRRTGADFIIAVMSGDFVQRGEPAFLDQHVRARMALMGGADLVLELPLPFSCSSAEIFAAAGVHILNGLGCVDALAFGIEPEALAVFDIAAEILTEESPALRNSLSAALKRGLSFPAARMAALQETLSTGSVSQEVLTPGAFPTETLAHGSFPMEALAHGSFPLEALAHGQVPTETLAHGPVPTETLAHGQVPTETLAHGPVSPEELTALASPNAILALEYAKALRRSGSFLTPVPIPRAGSGYHDQTLTGNLPSATALRKALLAWRGTELPEMQVSLAASCAPAAGRQMFSPSSASPEFLPDPCWQALRRSWRHYGPVTANDLSLLLHCRLLALTSPEEMGVYPDISPSLANRIFKLRNQFTTYEGFAALVKTRNETLTHIRRGLLSLALDMQRSHTTDFSRTADSAYTADSSQATDFAHTTEFSQAADFTHTTDFSQAADFAQSTGFRQTTGTVQPGSKMMQNGFELPAYTRILGMKKTAAPLLHQIKQCTAIPVLTKPADAKSVIKNFPGYSPAQKRLALEQFRRSCDGANQYQALLTSLYGEPFHPEATRSPEIL